MEKLIRRWEDRIGETISQNSILVGVVLVVLVVVICALGYGQSWLVPCGGAIGGCIALYQWHSDRRVKRAELLKELLFKYNEFDIEQLLRSESGTKQSKSDEVYFDLFSFLSYVCHLYRSSVLTDREFSSLKWDVVKILENRYVLELISDAYEGTRKEDRPYHDLVKVGEENCIETFARCYGDLVRSGRCMFTDNRGDVLISAGDSFPNHLSVLNGVFYLGYRAHRRSVAVVGKNKLVWFANMINGVPPIGRRTGWYNDWDESRNMLREYWPSNEQGELVAKEEIRYTFGKYAKERGIEYRFLGVFKFVGIDDENQCRMYSRERTEITKADL